jgi:hypothetical protein
LSQMNPVTSVTEPQNNSYGGGQLERMRVTCYVALHRSRRRIGERPRNCVTADTHVCAWAEGGGTALAERQALQRELWPHPYRSGSC